MRRLSRPRGTAGLIRYRGTPFWTLHSKGLPERILRGTGGLRAGSSQTKSESGVRLLLLGDVENAKEGCPEDTVRDRTRAFRRPQGLCFVPLT